MSAKKPKADPTKPAEDVDTLIPPPTRIIVVEGVQCRVRRIKTREFLALVRIITVGMGPAAAQVQLDVDDPDALKDQVMGLLLATIPTAIDEFAEFLVTVVEPVDSNDRAKLNQSMVNPEPEVTLEVIETLAEQELVNFRELAGKARAALARMQSLYRAAG